MLFTLTHIPPPDWADPSHEDYDPDAVVDNGDAFVDYIVDFFQQEPTVYGEGIQCDLPRGSVGYIDPSGYLTARPCADDVNIRNYQRFSLLGNDRVIVVLKSGDQCVTSLTGALAFLASQDQPAPAYFGL